MTDAARERAAANASPQFAARLAHELRSPLGVIMGALRERRDAEESASSGGGPMLVLANRAAERLVRLARRLELLAEVGGQGPSPRLQPLDLAHVAQDVIEDALAGRRQKFVVAREGLDRAAPIVADLDLVGAAVREVFDNATKHAKSEVRVSLAHAGSEYRLEIVDDGPGVSGRTLEQLLGEAGRSGLGIGLLLARAAVVSHGGSVELCSEPRDGGTRVTLRLRAV